MKSRAVGSLTHPGDSEWNSEPMDLVELLKRPDGKTLEFKRDLSTPEGALRTIGNAGRL